jgi:CRP/FNR family transcriptional regulator, dissimilatory nitrate respiration regulator
VTAALDADLLAALRAHFLFAGLEPEQFAHVAGSGELIELAAEQILFQRGEPARQFFIVVSGEVKLALQSRAGDEKVVERLGPGHSFAEALMFVDAPRYPLAAIALEPSRVLAIGAAEFVAMLRASPDTCLRLLADLSRRLHARIREIEELTLESATRRLARHLLELAPTGAAGPLTVTLDESRQLLASRLAIKPETLSRILRSLADAGAIRIDGRQIELTDPVRLRAVG